MQYRARAIRKSFGGIAALRGVDFTARAGSVHAVIGENGAGKSTLLNILAGALAPDEGTLELDGRPVSFSSTADALDKGIAMVSQELSLFPDLDLLGNLFPVGAPTRWGLVDRDEAWQRSRRTLADLGVDRRLDTLVGELGLAEQQLVEIARAVVTEPSVLILDEPTSALDRGDVDLVHGVLDVLRARDVAVVYVSHILEDVIDHVDTVTVLRDGAVALEETPAAELTISAMISTMVGREIEARRAPPPPEGLDGAPLRVTGLAAGSAHDVDLVVRPGEVVGLAGLADAGHHAVFDALAGVTPARAGEVVLPGGARNPATIRDAVRSGVAIVPGDRKTRGFHADAPVWQNVAHVRSFGLADAVGVVRRPPLLDRARHRISQLRIAAPSATAITSELSGGNQQKVVFAKWVEAEPSVILMDDPTRGIDVGGREEVWGLVEERSRDGAVQVVLSSDPLELASICHRVLVFRNGRVARELSGPDLTHANILEAANSDTPPASPRTAGVVDD